MNSRQESKPHTISLVRHTIPLSMSYEMPYLEKKLAKDTTPLSQIGELQATALAMTLREWGLEQFGTIIEFDHIVCGPHARQWHTATKIAEDLGIPPEDIIIHPLLKEAGLDGISDVPLRQIPKQYQHETWGGGIYVINTEGVQDLSEVYDEARKEYELLRAQFQGENILVITSTTKGLMLKGIHAGKTSHEEALQHPPINYGEIHFLNFLNDQPNKSTVHSFPERDLLRRKKDPLSWKFFDLRQQARKGEKKIFDAFGNFRYEYSRSNIKITSCYYPETVFPDQPYVTVNIASNKGEPTCKIDYFFGKHIYVYFTPAELSKLNLTPEDSNLNAVRRQFGYRGLVGFAEVPEFNLQMHEKVSTYTTMIIDSILAHFNEVA